MILFKITTRATGILLILLIVFTSSQCKSLEALNEDFVNVTDWTIESWDRRPTFFYRTNETGFTVIDGILRAPNSTTSTNLTTAYKNSSTAYGTWKFDWYFNNATYEDIVAFVFNDPENNFDLSGNSEEQFLDGTSGYGLRFDEYGEENLLNLILFSFSSYDNYMNEYQFPSQISPGAHNITIKRNYQGEFNVLFDSELKIIAQNNLTKTSTVFLLASVKGDTGFDNVTIDNAEPEVEMVLPSDVSFAKFGLAMFTLLITTVVLRNRKRK